MKIFEQSFVKENFRTFFSVAAILFLNFLFVLKYSYIYLGSYSLPTFFYLAILVLFLLVFFKKDFRLPSKTIGIILLAFALLSFLYVLAVPRIGAVNRLPAIQDWWRLFEKGEFPYNSKLTPSSFPALFLFSYPFYKLNLLGLLEPIAITILFYLVLKVANGEKEKTLATFLIFTSPIIYYSLVVRCELTFNTTVLILIFYLFTQFNDPGKTNLNFYILSILAGFFLATRSVFVIPFIIFSLFHFRENFKTLFLHYFVIAFVFLLLLLPFYLWDKTAFLANGPFAIQSKLSALPMWVVGIAILISIYAGWTVANFKQVLFVSGILLLLLPLISHLIKIADFGFHTAFFEDKIDLSYLEFSFVFFLLAIGKERQRNKV